MQNYSAAEKSWPPISVTDEQIQVFEFDESSVQKKRKKVYWSQWVAAMILSLIMLLVGLSIGWASPYLAKLSSRENADGIPKASDKELTWLASLMNVGRIFGVCLGAILQEIIGRKVSLYLCGVPMLCSWLCTAAARSMEWLYAARILCGLSAGVMYMVLPHYLPEIADPEIRGSLVLWNLTVHSFGVFLGNLMGPYLPMSVFSYICIAINVLYLILMLFIPDTPHRYITLNNLDKAEESLRWLRRSANVKVELKELQDYVANSKCSLAERWEELKDRRYLGSFFMMFLVNIFTYFNAYNVIYSYMEIILTSSRIDANASTVVTVCGLSSVLSSLLATFLVDRLGRRLLLLTSTLGMAVSLTFLGVHFKFLDLGYDPVALTWLPILCMWLYIVSYNAGTNSIPIALVGELFSPRLKSIASLNFSGSNAVFSSISNGTFIPLLNALGEFYLFLFYSCGVYASFAYYYFCAPETKGKTLSDIQAEKK